MGTSTSGLTLDERVLLLNAAFLPSAPVNREDLLAGRQDQRFRLLDMSQTMGGHAAVFGQRGVGKTSVVSVFESDMLSRNVVVARINCSVDSDFSSLIVDLSVELQQSSLISDLEASWISAVLPEGFAQPDIVRMLSTLSATRRVILILDEFDVLTDPSVAEKLANLMKALADKHVDSHLIVVGVAEDVESIMRGHASVARGLKQVEMPNLVEDELKTILNAGAKTLGLKYDPALAQRVVRLSQGLPHYTHLVGKELARRAILGERDDVGLNDWNPALEAALKNAQQQIIDLYTQAITTSKSSMFPSLLLACALAKKDQQGYFRPADVHPHLNRLTGKTYAMAAFTGNLSSLATENRGPALQSKIFAGDHKRYRFANPLLQPYVLLKAVADGQLEEGFIDDEVWGD